MKQTRKSWAGLYSTMAATTLGVLAPTAALAVDFTTITPDASSSTWTGLVNRVVGILLFIAGAVAVIYLLWSGVQYVTAGGDDEKATSARKGIINAIIGIVIVSAAFLIFNASVATVGNTNTSGTTGADL